VLSQTASITWQLLLKCCMGMGNHAVWTSPVEPARVWDRLGVLHVLAAKMTHAAEWNRADVQVDGAKGQTHPGVYSAMRHIFSLYEHGHSDVDAYINAVWAFKHHQSASNLSGEFIVTAIPYAPKGACAFEELEYMEDPYSVCFLECHACGVLYLPEVSSDIVSSMEHHSQE
jgi:hypothetical protein